MGTFIALPQNPSGITAQSVQNQSFYQAFTQLQQVSNNIGTVTEQIINIPATGVGQLSTQDITTPSTSTLTANTRIDISIQTSLQGCGVSIGSPWLDIIGNVIGITLINPSGAGQTLPATKIIVRLFEVS